LEMTQKKLGMTTISNAQRRLQGIFTDGDLRRAFERDIHLQTTLIKDVMTRQCKTIQPGMLAIEALQLMETYKITSLVVTEVDQTIVGVLHMHDILRAGLAC
jgi:arabinose-5-phosphate isomerase